MLIKLICIDSLHTDIAAKQIEANGYRAVIVGRAVITNHTLNGEALATIKTNAMAYTDEITNFDIECWEQSK